MKLSSRRKSKMENENEGELTTIQDKHKHIDDVDNDIKVESGTIKPLKKCARYLNVTSLIISKQEKRCLKFYRADENNGVDCCFHPGKFTEPHLNKGILIGNSEVTFPFSDV